MPKFIGGSMGKKKIAVIGVDKEGIPHEYTSMTDAAKDINGQTSHISECKNKKRRTHKGYEWK